MPKENYLTTSGKTVIVKLTPFLNLALHMQLLGSNHFSFYSHRKVSTVPCGTRATGPTTINHHISRF